MFKPFLVALALASAPVADQPRAQGPAVPMCSLVAPTVDVPSVEPNDSIEPQDIAL